jgi:hypothetical protein
MKNKGIYGFLIALSVVLIVIIVAEFLSSRPDKQKANPYHLETDQFYSVDKGLIGYREFRQLKLSLSQPAGISGYNGLLTVVGDQTLVALTSQGMLLFEKTLDIRPLCVKRTKDKIYIGGEKRVLALDSTGTFLFEFSGLYENSVITSIDVHHDQIFVADAGKRLVYRFNREGVKELEINGKGKQGSEHGFVVPSPAFDLGFNDSGELWIVNPGKHALENYSPEGELRGWWKASDNGISGFSGCCNPAHFAFLPGGNFITSEKRIVRVKEYLPSGEMKAVVAPPVAFGDETDAPDVYCDEGGRIYLLDIGRKMIRVFEKTTR